jgi:cytochrome c
MFRFLKSVVLLACLSGNVFAQSTAYPGVGRAATSREVAAWDIDVRPDFKGLPAGSGSVAQGQDVWEAKCAMCHGVFGESNEVFMPLIGGTTADDIKTGHVAALRRSDFPGRTTLMKVATVSTLWDYINRAMPWTSPKSLKPDEVYSVLAYLLNLAGVVPDDYVLSNQNIAQVQQRMPNRNGMQTSHALWPGKEFSGSTKSDTANVACMKDCATEVNLASQLPAFARNAHGNLAEQNRLVGEQKGADTTQPERQGLSGPVRAPVAMTTTTTAQDSVLPLLQKHNCLACHAVDHKVVGPALRDVAQKYPDKVDYLAGKIKSGGSGIWGSVPMPAQTAPDADIQRIANWLAKGATK